MHPRINRAHCLLHAHLIDTARVLPTDIATMHLPPVVNISLQNGKAGDRLGVIAVDSIHSAVFREMGYAPPERRKNVSLEYIHCQCGEYHVHVTLTEHVMSGDVLTPCSFGPPKIFCQFDGSAHRAKTIGGAGAAMYVLSEQGLQLLDWSCLSIPKCPDNIVAEVLGADLSLRLYERYVHGCLSHNSVPLPLDRIQGFKEISCLCLVTYDFRLVSDALILLLSLIDFIRREVALLHRLPQSIGLGKPTSSLIILPGEGPPSSCITQRIVRHSKVSLNMILIHLTNFCCNIMRVSLASTQRVKPSWSSERHQPVRL